MPTILSFLSGRQITNDSGVPQSGAKVYHYRATTTTNLTVWQLSDATVPHTQPVVCDAGGFVPLIYVDDTFNWKIVVTTAADVILPQYNFDNLPKAESDESALGFAPPLFPWTQVTSGASPVALTAADAGNAYEADTTGGNIEFDLPSAASVGDGKGFLFKKAAAANSMVIDPFGSETIDDSATSITVTRQHETVGIFSNGAEWYRVVSYLDNIGFDRLPAASDTAQGALEIAVQSEMEAGTDVARAVVPGRQHFHPSAAKFWVTTTGGGTPAIGASYNVTSVTDTGTGVLGVTIATDFSSANWACVGSIQAGAGTTVQEFYFNHGDKQVGSVLCGSTADSGAPIDPTDGYSVVGYGDQA